jgi:Adenylate and Guanylate cyclase catalytic domain
VSEGDFHDPKYDSTKVVVPLSLYQYNETSTSSGHCVYSFHLYNSDHFTVDIHNEFDIKTILTLAVSIIFVAMALAFCMYDRFVRRRNAKVVSAAARSNAIISSLFPTQVRDRLFAEKIDDKCNLTGAAGTKSRLKSMLNSGDLTDVGINDADDELGYKSKPIADLFPETTILFADIAGFTAWSSVREPSQVFILLETLYRAFGTLLLPPSC